MFKVPGCRIITQPDELRMQKPRQKSCLQETIVQVASAKSARRHSVDLRVQKPRQKSW
jgi:hypothetical protein